MENVKLFTKEEIENLFFEFSGTNLKYFYIFNGMQKPRSRLWKNSHVNEFRKYLTDIYGDFMMPLKFESNCYLVIRKEHE